MGRKINKKEARYKVAIVGEGITEWYYFTSMRKSERFDFKVEPDLPKHSDYKTIIKTARKKRDEGYDLVFCVIDLDRILTNQTEKKGYKAEKSKTKSNTGIEFIETMPCIELWFLLHFRSNYSSKVFLNYKQVVIPLRKYIPNYDKSSIFFKSLDIYEYLNTNGSYQKANELARESVKEKINSDDPLFNFTQINILINTLKNR